MPELVLYLREQAAHPFAWGEADCVTFIADWIALRRDGDPAAEVRGRYHDKGTGDALKASWGGLTRSVGRALRKHGMRLTRDPRPGDVAMVAIGAEVCCCIWTGKRWATRLETGLALSGHGRLIAAWRL